MSRALLRCVFTPWQRGSRSSARPKAPFSWRRYFREVQHLKPSNRDGLPQRAGARSRRQAAGSSGFNEAGAGSPRRGPCLAPRRRTRCACFNEAGAGSPAGLSARSSAASPQPPAMPGSKASHRMSCATRPPSTWPRRASAWTRSRSISGTPTRPSPPVSTRDSLPTTCAGQPMR